LDYSDTDIDYISGLDLVASTHKARLGHMTPTVAEHSVPVAHDGRGVTAERSSV
jgi:hypothetical protein